MLTRNLQFKFKCSYRNEADYEVWGTPKAFLVTYCTQWGHASSREYDMSIFNGNEEEYREEVDAKINTLSIHSYDAAEFTPELYDAFCLFLQESHAASMQKIREMYDRWETPENERDWPEPPVIPVPVTFDLSAGTWVPCAWFTGDVPRMEALIRSRIGTTA